MRNDDKIDLKLKTMAQKAEVNFQPRVWFDIPITLWLIEDVLVPTSPLSEVPRRSGSFQSCTETERCIAARQ